MLFSCWLYAVFILQLSELSTGQETTLSITVTPFDNSSSTISSTPSPILWGDPSWCYNTSTFINRTDCTTAFEIYIYLLLSKPYEQLTEESLLLVDRILQPCANAKEEGNGSVFTFLPRPKDGFFYVPVLQYKRDDKTVTGFDSQQWYHDFSPESLGDSLQSYWDVLSTPATDPRRQKVIYLATDCNTTEMGKFYLNYWEQLKWFMDNNTNPEVASMFGLILLGEPLIGKDTEDWLEMIQKNPVTGKYFSYKQFSGIYDDSISDYFGLCERLPVGEPPASRKSHKMNSTQIIFISIGVVIFLIICIIVLCIRCGRWCWRPNLKGFVVKSRHHSYCQLNTYDF